MDSLEQLWSRIKRSEKVCFFSALFWGLATHMYMLTNKLSNWDDLANFRSYGVGGEFGRFMLKPLNRLTVEYSNPWVNGTVAIVLIAAACVVVYKILDLESSLSGILLSLIVMTFPGLTGTMTFMFTVDLYALGILLAVFVAYMMTRNKMVLWPFAVVCMIISMGIYQSYICFTITLLLLHMMKELLAGAPGDVEEGTDVSEPTGKLFKGGIIYAVFLAVSTVLYILTAHWRYPGLNQEEYNGVGAMGSIDLARLPRLIVKAYLRFFRYFLVGDYSFMTDSYRVLHVSILLLMAACWGILLYYIRKDRLRVAFAVLVTVLLPLGNSFVDVMAPDASFSILMLYQYCLVYVALIAMAERISKTDKRILVRGISMAAVLLICVMGYKQYQLAGEAYFRMDMAYRRSYAFLQRVAMHVEEQEDYRKGEEFCILGSFDGEYSESQNMNGERFKDLSGVALEYGMLTSGAREQFARIYLGLKLKGSNGEEVERIKATEEYKSMDCYPTGQCIRKIDGLWIVKLSD